MNVLIRNILMTLLLINSYALADTAWEENFDDSAIQGKGATGSSSGPIIDMTGVTKWSIDVSGAQLTASDDWFRVENGLFEGRDTDGDAIWESEDINITGLSDVNFTLDASESGKLEDNGIGIDYFDVYYSVDGGAYSQIPNLQGKNSAHTLVGDFNSTTISQDIGTGHTSLKIKVVMNDKAGNEYLRLDNVRVETSTPLPVTIAYVYPQIFGSTLELAFTTASETANIGFNIYCIKGKAWTKMNDEIFVGALDSFEPQNYNISLDLPENVQCEKIGIASVDTDGKEVRYGPFKVGKEKGRKSTASPVNWKKVKEQIHAERQLKKAKKNLQKKGKRDTREKLRSEKLIFKVSQNALYRVTHEELLAQGINLVGFKTDKIALSFKNKGVPRHIENAKNGRWTSKSALTFMGEKPNKTDALYVGQNHYRLSLNKKWVVESEAFEPLTVKETVIDNNKKYAYTMPLDDPFYEAFFYTTNADDTATYTTHFDLSEVSNVGVSTLSIYTGVTTKGSHRMSVSLNGVPLTETTARDRSKWIITTQIDNSLLRETDNALTFTLYGEADGMDIVAYDKLIIRSDTKEAIEPKSVEIGKEEKVWKKSLKLENDADYLIITHPLFMNETLDTYVAQRQSEGWKIKVVNVEDIYTAYSDGMAVPESIQRYISYASRRGVGHVQLIGASNYDYHNYLGLGAVSLIPSPYTLTNGFISYTPSDAWYAMGKNNLPKVAIGRWPVRTVEEFEHIVKKTLSWQGDTTSALLIADQTDQKGNIFTPQMEAMEKTMEVSGYQTKDVYLDRFNEEYGEESAAVARDEIAHSLISGVSIVSYCGHGSPTQWSPVGLLKESDVDAIDTSSIAPVALPFSCMATYADSPMSNTLAHRLLTSQNGFVAVYGATTYSTYADNGMIIGKVFQRLTQGETLGEAIMHSKHEIGNSYTDLIKNGNLLGDVTLRLK
jgi:hypothetical protein